MSYKTKLSELQRDGGVSITQQLVDLLVEAIESGELGPGEKLPTTRALAADAGVNHLTAARVYRRLAELGYVTATVGRGTFVRALPPAAGETGDDWQVYVLPDRPITYAEQVLADAFRLADEPGVVSLSTGYPSPRCYPTEELAQITADVFAEEGGDALSYLVAEGLWQLRDQLAARGRTEGYATEPEEILVTSGARQGIDLVSRALIDPGDVVAIETPTFMGLLSCRNAGARVVGVPVDEHGFDTDALERILARHEVKLVMLQTACHNPTGRDTSEERRRRLAELAVERNFFVLEDRVYADTRIEGGEGPRPLRELAPSHVIYVNSLSKTVGGGLRVGWIAARGPVFERLAALKLESDFHTPTLVQHIAARYLASGGYDRQIAQTKDFYRERRDALMASLERHLAGEYRAERPSGGHHLWVTLTRPVNERELYTEALRHGVTFTPGGVVSVERPGQTSFRLSFSLLEPDELDEGVKRLARAIREVRRRERLGRTGSGRATMPVS